MLGKEERAVLICAKRRCIAQFHVGSAIRGEAHNGAEELYLFVAVFTIRFALVGQLTMQGNCTAGTTHWLPILLGSICWRSGSMASCTTQACDALCLGLS